MEGIVFNIQKFSIHDGPGIRTTVFLKGCPLHCKWCANPESQSPHIQIIRDDDLCIHCHHCQKICPKQAILEDLNITSACDGCLTCVNECPVHALSYEGKKMSVEDVVKICLQDRDFYEESGGGVTISGGEGMMQPPFVKALVTALKEEHIHVAIETTGYASEQVFQELAPLFDLLLFDVKHYDDAKHQEGTGVTHQLIDSNMRYAIAHHIPLLARIPVIPGFNDSLEDAEGLAAYLLSCQINKVQLLPFHQMGENKYAKLHRNYAYTNVKAYHEEDLNEYADIFRKQGVNAFFHTEKS